MKVLVLDDDTEKLQRFGRVLLSQDKLGIQQEPDCRSNLEEALQLLETRPYDLFITDMNLDHPESVWGPWGYSAACYAVAVGVNQVVVASARQPFQHEATISVGEMRPGRVATALREQGDRHTEERRPGGCPWNALHEIRSAASAAERIRTIQMLRDSPFIEEVLDTFDTLREHVDNLEETIKHDDVMYQSLLDIRKLIFPGVSSWEARSDSS